MRFYSTLLFLLALACPSAGLWAQGLAIVSGNGQIAGEQFLTVAPLVVQAKDAPGNPAAGVTVTFRITQGAGTLPGGGIVTTDSNGLASTLFLGTGVPPSLSYAPATVTASSSAGSVDFIVTTVPIRLPSGVSAAPPLAELKSPSQDNRMVTGKSGSTLPGAVVVLVTAQNGVGQGQGIPNVGLRVENALDPAAGGAYCNGPAHTVFTNAQGFATCDLVITGSPGQIRLAAVPGESLNRPGFGLQITAGSACSYVLSGLSQSFSSVGGQAGVIVSTGSACSWTASSNANWITIVGGSSGIGGGTAIFVVGPNTSGAARTGTLLIAGQTYTVNQSAGSGPAPLVILNGGALPQGVVNTAYSAALVAQGGTPPYTWSIGSGALPSGLVLNSATGAITGVPTVAGQSNFSATVQDHAGVSVSQPSSISVAPAGASSLAIANGPFPNATVGQSYQQTLLTSGACMTLFGPRTPVFTLAGGALPGGLSIIQDSNMQYLLSGVPAQAGNYMFMLKATDGCGSTAFGNFSMAVVTPGVLPVATAPAALQFTAVAGGAAANSSLTLAITSGGHPIGYSVTASSMGNWLTISGGANGVTPGSATVTAVNTAGLAAGTYMGTVTVTPQSGSAVSVPVTLTITAPPMPPVLTATPFALTFTQMASNGGAPPQQSITITGAPVAVPFTVTTAPANSAGWLFVTPGAGTTPATLVVSVNTAQLAAGSYSGSIVITPMGGPPATVAVTLSVAASPMLLSITNAATFAPGPVAPGEFVTLFGSLLGPEKLTTLTLTSSGTVDNALAGTRVWFDGIAAPLIYTSAKQVTAIVPYEVAGRTSTHVQAEFMGVRSDPIEVRVVDAAPGLFVADGSGQGAILNQDGSPNSVRNGAEPGTVVSIFGTGEGQTDPGGSDGAIVSTVLAKPLQLVRVEIGGQPAEVLYAGSAPSLPAGVVQVNARIPLSAAPGMAASVVVKVGGASSQSGVTVFVKP